MLNIVSFTGGHLLQFLNVISVVFVVKTGKLGRFYRFPFSSWYIMVDKVGCLAFLCS